MIEEILRNISEAERAAHRKVGDVTLMAVTKSLTPDRLESFLVETKTIVERKVVFGENYLPAIHLKWQNIRSVKPHFIGLLQNNKLQKIVESCSGIDSVTSLNYAVKLNNLLSQLGVGRYPIFLQVNISHDLKKGGIDSDALPKVYDQICDYCHSLEVVGLMTITKFYEQPSEAAADFSKMYELRESVNKKLVLSMGMSRDYQLAIREGADLVRIGTALFSQKIFSQQLFS